MPLGVMSSYKVFNDCVHSHIKLHPLCVTIMDTPEFQRLRNVKQLGTVYYVYPGGSHNRFEHSLGVCYLAGQMVEALRRASEDPNIVSDDEKLCVEVAGLCHDLGHGPFSHSWEHFVNNNKNPKDHWKHESSSIMMFDYLIKENNLESKIEEARYLKNIEFDDFVICVKSMIKGDDSGVLPNKKFLYQIVNNQRNGIDVDHWDYFLRDGLQLNIRFPFDYKRLLENSRVLDFNGESIICFRKKGASDIYDMFRARAMLYYKAYRHPVGEVLEEMMIDAFYLAEKKGFKIGTGDNREKLSEAHEKVELLNQMTDHVFYDILYSTEYKDASYLLKRILMRDLYPILGRKNFSADLVETMRKKEKPLSSAQDMKDFVKDMNLHYKKELENDIHKVVSEMPMLDRSKFQAKIISINLGIEIGAARSENGKINPFKNIYFYEKNETKPMVIDWQYVPIIPVPEECIHRIEGIIFYKKGNSEPEEVSEQLENFKAKLKEAWEPETK